MALAALAVVLFAACGGGCEVNDVHLRPAPPVAVGDRLQVGVRERSCPQDAVHRWRAETGIFAPQESPDVTTIYVARSPGTDRITVEVISRSTVIAEKTFDIPVLGVSERKREEGSGPEPAPSREHAQTPVIRITDIPPYAPEGGPLTKANIAGVTSGTEPGQRVVIYACTDVCYVQPLVAAPYTAIGADGSWSTWTHTGKSYVALLVESDFKPQAVIAAPGTSLEGVVTRAVVEGKR